MVTGQIDTCISCEHTLVQSFFYGTIFADMATSTIQKYSSTKLQTILI